jgi:dTDP-4-dehydrorhamnose 3,5-epimerase-like enzyme
VDIIDLKPDFTDERGTITDLVNGVEFSHAGVITSVKGSIRGNHYHRRSSQYTYVMSGRIELVSRDHGGEIETAIFEKGGFFLSPPEVDHAMRFLEDTEFLVLTTYARDDGGYEDDTVRLDPPLIS